MRFAPEIFIHQQKRQLFEEMYTGASRQAAIDGHIRIASSSEQVDDREDIRCLRRAPHTAYNGMEHKVKMAMFVDQVRDGQQRPDCRVAASSSPTP